MATRVIERSNRTATYESAAFPWTSPKMAIHLIVYDATATPNLTVNLKSYNDLTASGKVITDLAAVNPTASTASHYLFYVVDVVSTPTASGITDSHHAYIPDKVTIEVVAGDSDACEYAVDVQEVN